MCKKKLTQIERNIKTHVYIYNGKNKRKYDCNKQIKFISNNNQIYDAKKRENNHK